MEEGRALSTLKILSAAFSYFSDPIPSNFTSILSHLHTSTKRKYTVAHHDSIPPSHIDALVQYASLHPFDVTAIRTALGAAIAFGALLRVSELLALRRDDLQLSPTHLKITVAKAKNDQFGEGRETFIEVPEDSITLSIFHSYGDKVPASPWLFPSISHPDLPLSADTFRKDLTRLCASAGVPRMTPHQLRSGGANESIRRGTPLEEVQRRGRWKSLAGITPYVKDTLEAQGGALALP
ncbi:hypothetical protein DXG03_006737 [Asterophora parasitica]|uniref:Tyr recombinase domain-containing protein n=1 Tax=Asterophora parasitica TaxID=117018 RepID=A0A9P7K8A5_9AGAR|nr:hypothetical protein DXG03_006737 [Asterophora parasitica]